jgi:predicted NAD/FAD-binding protein
MSDRPNRREALRTLAAAAGTAGFVVGGLGGCGDSSSAATGREAGSADDAAVPVDGAADAAISGGEDAAGARRPHIAVIGGGLAGLSAAFLLDGVADVIVYEAGPSVGGNVHTAEVEVRGERYAVDVGAQYFNGELHAAYVALLGLLGVDLARADVSPETGMTMTVFATGEPTPRFVSPLPPSRLWPLNEAWNAAGIGVFNRLAAAARRAEDEALPYDVPLAQFFADAGFTPEEVEGLLRPWAVATTTCVLADVEALSARSILAFLSRALRPDGLPVAYYRTLRAGLRDALDRMVQRNTTVTVRRETRATSLERVGSGFSVGVGAQRADFDAVVLAVHGGTAAGLLGGLPDASRLAEAMRTVPFFKARLGIHHDRSHLPAEPRHWSSINMAVTATHCESCMHLDPLLAPHPDGAPLDLFKSWITYRSRPPEHLLAEVEFEHMAPTVDAMRAQDALAALAGTVPGIHVVGGWTQHLELQETALRTAVAAARAIAPEAPNLRALEAVVPDL